MTNSTTLPSTNNNTVSAPKIRLIHRVYYNPEHNKYLLVEEHPSGFADDIVHPYIERKPNRIVFLTLWSGSLAEIEDYAAEHEITLPQAERIVYPDWFENLEYVIYGSLQKV